MITRSLMLAPLPFVLSGWIMLCPQQRHSSATGVITGSVLDRDNRPVAGIQVMAVYVRGWTTLCPPGPNAFVAGVAHTDGQGRFRIYTSKRVDELDAGTGRLLSVKANDNLIHISPLPELPIKLPANRGERARSSSDRVRPNSACFPSWQRV